MLKVSTSGYYEWRHRPVSARDVEDAWLIDRLRVIHDRSRGTYGVRRCNAEFRLAEQERLGHKRVARLMRLAGLQAVHRRRWRHTKPAEATWPDRVECRFTAEAPDRLWVTDITQHRTGQGWVY